MQSFTYHASSLFLAPCIAGYYLSGYVVDYRSRKPGTLDEALVPVCSACPLGSYQNEQGSTECIACPEYSTTVSEGSAECTSMSPNYMKITSLLDEFIQTLEM